LGALPVNEPAVNKKPLHFPQLDALRFLAAFMVVFVHAYENWINWFGIPKPLTSADPKAYNWFGQHLSRLIGNFNFGVDMFFLISGFLITYLLLKEKKEAGKINIKNFFIRRTLRIWPLYFFIIGLSPLLVWWMGWPHPEYKPVIFFYNNFRTIATERWDFPFAHFWSICVEEHFYLVWPFLIAFIPTKKLPFVFLFVMAISIGYRYHAHGNPDVTWYSVYLNTISRIDALALGGLVAWIHFHRPFRLRMPLAVRILIYIGILWSLSTDDLGDWPNAFELAWKKYFYLLLIGLMMMNYVFNPEAKMRWSANHPINYLGRCCFGIYLWGNILLQILLHKLILPHIPSGNGWLYWSIVLGMSLLVPIISYELIEKPFMKLKSRFEVVKTRV
jgi:peptidoglycan/LPS O-acetylase OafA/YrhL